MAWYLYLLIFERKHRLFWWFVRLLPALQLLLCYIVLAFLGTAVFGGLGTQTVPGTAAVGGQAGLGNQAELENYLALLGKAVGAPFPL